MRLRNEHAPHGCFRSRQPNVFRLLTNSVAKRIPPTQQPGNRHHNQCRRMSHRTAAASDSPPPTHSRDQPAIVPAPMSTAATPTASRTPHPARRAPHRHHPRAHPKDAAATREPAPALPSPRTHPARPASRSKRNAPGRADQAAATGAPSPHKTGTGHRK